MTPLRTTTHQNSAARGALGQRLAAFAGVALTLAACCQKQEAPPAPAPASTAAATTAAAATATATARQAPTAAPAAAAGGLAPGKHGCMMVEGGDSYNRLCTVTAQADGSLLVKAPGTSLNPNNGFEFRATGGPDSYQIEGKMSAFSACVGSFTSAASREDIGGKPWFVAKFAPQGKDTARCKIMIRAPKAEAPSNAQCSGENANSELPCPLKDGRWGWCKGGICKNICPPGHSYHPNDTRCHQRRDCKPGMGDDGMSVKTARCNECFGEHCFDPDATRDLL